MRPRALRLGPLLTLVAVAGCAGASGGAASVPQLPSAHPTALTAPQLVVPYPVFCNGATCTVSVTITNPSDVVIPIGAQWLRISDQDGSHPPETIKPSDVTQLQPGATVSLSLLIASGITTQLQIVYTGPTGRVSAAPPSGQPSVPAPAVATSPPSGATPPVRPVPPRTYVPPPVVRVPPHTTGNTNNPGGASGSLGD